MVGAYFLKVYSWKCSASSTIGGYAMHAISCNYYFTLYFERDGRKERTRQQTLVLSTTVLSNAVSYDRLFNFLLELARCFGLHAYTWHHSHFQIVYIYSLKHFITKNNFLLLIFLYVFVAFLVFFSFVNYLPQRLQWPQLVGDTLTANFSVIDRLKWQMSMREQWKKERSEHTATYV